MRRGLRSGARRSGARRIGAAAGIFLVGALLLATLAAWLVLRASLPALDGRAAHTGVQANVRVERDTDGVPSITAQNRNDLAFGLGYLHAQDRFFQMDLLRRAAAGELAALLGPSLLADRSVSCGGIAFATSRARRAESDAPTRAVLDAYVARRECGLARRCRAGRSSTGFSASSPSPGPPRTRCCAHTRCSCNCRTLQATCSCSAATACHAPRAAVATHGSRSARMGCRDRRQPERAAPHPDCRRGRPAHARSSAHQYRRDTVGTARCGGQQQLGSRGFEHDPTVRRWSRTTCISAYGCRTPGTGRASLTLPGSRVR